MSSRIRLRPVNHGTTKADRNTYCGPSAISSLTGMTTGEAARLLRATGGRRAIRGSYTSEMLRALRMCNINADCYRHAAQSGRRQTLAAWLKATKDARGDAAFLLAAGRHWLLVQGRRYVCGITKEVVPQKHPKVARRAVVTEAYRLTAVPDRRVARPAAARRDYEMEYRRAA
jgi:hypothetical protein